MVSRAKRILKSSNNKVCVPVLVVSWSTCIALKSSKATILKNINSVGPEILKKMNFTIAYAITIRFPIIEINFFLLQQ